MFGGNGKIKRAIQSHQSSARFHKSLKNNVHEAFNKLVRPPQEIQPQVLQLLKESKHMITTRCFNINTWITLRVGNRNKTRVLSEREHLCVILIYLSVYYKQVRLLKSSTVLLGKKERNRQVKIVLIVLFYSI